MEKPMKITVYQEDVEKIELFDDEDENLEAFARKLSNVFKSSTVSIIDAGNTALIVRPSKVISILIEDQSKEVQITSKSTKTKKKPKSNAKVDIITDVD
jgi:hypothetical protein